MSSSYKITLPAGSTWSATTEYDGQIVLDVVSDVMPQAMRVESLSIFDSPRHEKRKSASRISGSTGSVKRRLSFSSSLDDVVDESHGAPYSPSSEVIKPTQAELDQANEIIRKSRERSLSSSRLSSAPQFVPSRSSSSRESPSRSRSPSRSLRESPSRSASNWSPSRAASNWSPSRSASNWSPSRAASSASSRSPSRVSSSASSRSPSRAASSASSRSPSRAASSRSPSRVSSSSSRVPSSRK